MPGYDGHGTTITFSGFTMSLISVDNLEINGVSIDTTVMSTTDWEERIAGSIKSWSADVTVQVDVDEMPPVNTKGTFSVDFNGTDTPEFEGQAVMESFSMSAETGSRIEGSASFTGAGELSRVTSP